MIGSIGTHVGQIKECTSAIHILLVDTGSQARVKNHGVGAPLDYLAHGRRRIFHTGDGAGDDPVVHGHDDRFAGLRADNPVVPELLAHIDHLLCRHRFFLSWYSVVSLWHNDERFTFYLWKDLNRLMHVFQTEAMGDDVRQVKACVDQRYRSPEDCWRTV